MSSKNANLVFYAEAYHPIQAGSIDGTDVLPHDAAVYRALRCFNAGLYDPFGDPKIVGDPYCSLFVGRLNHSTTDQTLRQAMSKYGRVKNLRLVRHIVTGASRGYAFVEFETEREMRRAYTDAHHTFIDDSEIIVDYNRQQLMPGWTPRRLGGGLGGKKESGQLRFGGRERPFRAPLRQIPFDELKRLGIPLPPEGRYMSRFEVPSPPRRKVTMDDESDLYKPKAEDRQSRRGDRSPSAEPSSSRQRLSENMKDRSGRHEKNSRHLHSKKRRSNSHDYTLDDNDSSENKKEHIEEHHHRSSRQSYRHKRRSSALDYSSDENGSSEDKKDRSDKHHKSSRQSYQHGRKSTSHDYSSDDKSSVGRGYSHKHTYSRKDERRSPRRNRPTDE